PIASTGPPPVPVVVPALPAGPAGEPGAAAVAGTAAGALAGRGFAALASPGSGAASGGEVGVTGMCRNPRATSQTVAPAPSRKPIERAARIGRPRRRLGTSGRLFGAL